MKKLLFTLAILSVSSLMMAQSTTKNYISNTVYQIETTTGSVSNTEKIESVTYFDGLGRPIQNVAIRAGGQSQDIITHIDYDAFGRQDKAYLPYVSSFGIGTYRNTAESETKSYYDATKYDIDFPLMTTANINPYSEKSLEASPLNRIEKQAAPGYDWRKGGGHEIEFEYKTNTSNEVKRYEVTLTPIISGGIITYSPVLVLNATVNTGHYTAGALYKTITKDENWQSTLPSAELKNHTTEEFKDKQGRVVLKRTYATVSGVATAHDTYYVYDDYGNLSYVLPPKVVHDSSISSIELSELCYQYKYDEKNRLVEKKIPGKGWEYIVYDKLDRPVLTQDANQRVPSTDEWLFTKYDAFGRVAYTGLVQNNSNRVTLQNNANNTSLQYVTKSSATSLAGTTIYYTGNPYPTSGVFKIYTINYYDNYTFDKVSGNSETSYSVTPETNVKGLATGSKVRVLTTNDWITTVSYYDDKSRPIYVYSFNDYLDSTDKIKSQIDFSGQVNETTTTHTKNSATITTIDKFEYDHTGRLVTQTQKVNDKGSRRLVKNNYDELGQLESKFIDNGTQDGYKDIVGVSVNNDIITKTAGNGYGNAGLATNGSFTGDGYVEYEIFANNSRFLIGLSNSNSDASYPSIKYAIYNNPSNNLYLYESGSYKGHFGTYQAGDMFRVERIGSIIYYKKNGEVFYTSTVSSTGTLLGDISIYNTGDKVKDLKIVDNNKGIQTVDYAYNVRGWLKQINDPTTLGNDLFSFNINYNTVNHVGTKLFNGNIAETEWKTDNTDNSLKWYKYSYDALNRITNATDNTGHYNLNNVFYDKNGNITNFTRMGHVVDNPVTSNSSHFGTMDQLSYTYLTNSNKLLKVADGAALDNYGFKDDALNTAADNTDDYTYDLNGNLTSDENKGINSITYNHLNLPTSIQMSKPPQIDENGFITISPFDSGTLSYVYDALGNKLSKTFYQNNHSSFTHYAGNYVYAGSINSSINNLQFFNHPEGYVEPKNKFDLTQGFDYVYQYKDHLGNVRLSYQDSDNDGEITGGSTQVFFDDFESASGWDGSGATWGHSVTEFDSNFKLEGSYSARIYGDTESGVVAHSNQSVYINNSEDTDYVYSAWAYSDNPVIRLGIIMKEAGETGYMTLFDDIKVYDKIGEWVYVEKRVTIPANIAEINIRIECAAWWNRDGNVWFDNVSIRKVNDPAIVEILEENNYYPFGLKHKGYNNNPSAFANPALKWKYNGVEYEEALGLNLYEMDVRSYDPAIGRFTSIDPVTHWNMSTYTAFDNNPIFWADPSGADSIYNFDTQQYVINGQVVSQDEAIAYAQAGGNSDGSNNNTPNEDCPECDNKNILLDFMKEAGIQAGKDRANDEIHEAKNPLDPEIRSTNKNAVYVQNLIKITGSDRLKYKKGLKNIIKYVTGGTADYNRYEFLQKFELAMTGGSDKEFTANATILVKQDESKMNISYYGYPKSGVGLGTTAHIIKFYNSEGSLIANLSFNSKNIMDAFVNKYYTKYYKESKNKVIREYNESKK